jgi:hypothetical protein
LIAQFGCTTWRVKLHAYILHFYMDNLLISRVQIDVRKGVGIKINTNLKDRDH